MKKIEIASPIKRLLNDDNVAGYIFIAPWLFGFFAFTIIPMMVSLYLSFTNYNIISPPVWVGFDNFRRMFTSDPRYLKAVLVTLYYVLVSVPLKLTFALLMAMLLNKAIKLANLYRSVYYLPSLIGGSVAVAIMWKELFANEGVINSFLATIGIKAQVSWLGNPYTAIWTLVLLTVWQFGSSMLIFTAGLKQIPETYYEAAEIDGASSWQKFSKITLPMLSSVIFFNLVMQIIAGFMAFTQSFIITNGGPMDSTLFYALYTYQRAFQFFDMGYGCAMAWMLLIIIAFFTALVFRSSSYWVYYETKGKF